MLSFPLICVFRLLFSLSLVWSVFRLFLFFVFLVCLFGPFLFSRADWKCLCVSRSLLSFFFGVSLSLICEKELHGFIFPLLFLFLPWFVCLLVRFSFLFFPSRYET